LAKEGRVYKLDIKRLAMQDFFTKPEYQKYDLQQLITSQAEESLHLDFKASGSLDKTDKKKAEIGKDISAMANADGGTIIYGMSEVAHVATALSPIDGNIFTKEWLEQVLQTQISPKIAGLEIFPIRVDGHIGQSAYVVRVPASNLAPHMASDKRYYRRYNFESVPMEDYEVRNLFQRVQKAELEIADMLIENAGVSLQAMVPTSISFKIGFQVKNISNRIEHNYKLEVHIPLGLLVPGKSAAQSNFLRHEGGYEVFSFSNSSPLFQNELTTIKTLFITGHNTGYQILKKPILTKLYYSNGIKERQFPLEPFLTYGYKPLTEYGWR